MKNFVCTITPDELERLKAYLAEHEWEFSSVPYAHFKASHDKINLVAYLSGKLTIQGAKTGEFVEFVLEPEILQKIISRPDLIQEISPHGGVDESGKGDFFGPLVVAAVYVDESSGAALLKAGVCDSKLIKSDKKITELAKLIRMTVKGNFSLLTLKPETYNDLYKRIGNLNRLLAWGHARVIENLLEKVPDCPRVLSDKFGSSVLIERALMKRGRAIKVDQETKAESDVAVAAASILARDQFINVMQKLGNELSITLPRGASAQVKETARKLVESHGADTLQKYVKTHFKTYSEVILQNPDLGIFQA